MAEIKRFDATGGTPISQTASALAYFLNDLILALIDILK